MTSARAINYKIAFFRKIPCTLGYKFNNSDFEAKRIILKKGTLFRICPSEFLCERKWVHLIFLF